MALADYRLCDVCDRKVFYDSNLNYEWEKGCVEPRLENLGEWKVICTTCAETHTVVIQPRVPPHTTTHEIGGDDAR